MVITTTDLQSQKYSILDVLFVYGSSADGFLKTANPLEAYEKVRDSLKEKAQQVNADAVVGAKFDYRVAAGTGCGGNKKVFEVFAYGTAVKFE